VKTLLAIVMSLALVGSAYSAPRNHAEPPRKFLHKYAGELVIIYVQKGAAYRTCSEITGGNIAYYEDMLGCALGGVNEHQHRCLIVATIGKSHVLRHELAHCNGWPADHRR